MFIKTTLRLVWLFILGTSLALAAPPETINYQGNLTDNNGVPLQGNHNITFALYDGLNAASSNTLWTNVKTLNITDGLFTTELGSAISFGLAFDQPYYLGITVDGGVEMTPRQPLSSTPYAFKAIDADTIGGIMPANLALQSSLNSHTANTGNPHSVSAAQVGAATAADISAAVTTHTALPAAHHSKTSTFAELTDSISDAQIPTTLTRDSELTVHSGDTSNPHSVTASQVGAATVANISTHAGQASAHHPRYVASEAVAAVGSAWPTLSNAAGTGANNTAHGIDALRSNSTGNSNTASGAGALRSNSTGNVNTASGVGALRSNTTGIGNTASGVSALSFNTTGANNTASGRDALFTNTTGFNNTASGVSALVRNTTGANNTASGRDALRLNTTGNGNIALGYLAGDNITSGSNNIIIGFGIDAPSATSSQQLSIGNLIYATGMNQTGRTVSNGNVGIGTNTPSARLEVVNDVPTDVVARFKNTSTNGISGGADGIEIQTGPILNPGTNNNFINLRDGNGTLVGQVEGNGVGGVQYTTTSDGRLKTKVVDFNNGLALLAQLNVRQYEFISAPGKPRIGFIAQEVQPIYPQAVSGDPEGDVDVEPMGMDYGKLTPLLAAAIKELKQQKDTEIEQLKTRLERLEAFMASRGM